jgi:hypothetical protein
MLSQTAALVMLGAMNPVKHHKSACFRFAGRAVACLVLLAVSGCGQHRDAEVGDKRYLALGEVMATKLNEMAGGKGRLVLVVAESANNQSAAFGQTAAAFRKALGKSLRISVTETVAMPALLRPGAEPLPADKLATLLQKYSDTDYLVSFVGVPVLTPEQISQLPSRRPQVVAVVTFCPPTQAMFAQKVLCLAAVSKPEPDQAATGRPAQEMFDTLYQVVTPETADILTH